MSVFNNNNDGGENEATETERQQIQKLHTHRGRRLRISDGTHLTLRNDISKQIGLFVLQYAKLRMLQLYYDCLDRADFEMVQMDTENLHFAGQTIDSNADQTTGHLASHPPDA